MPKIESQYNHLDRVYTIYAQSQPFKTAYCVTLNKPDYEIDNGDLSVMLRILADQLNND